MFGHPTKYNWHIPQFTIIKLSMCLRTFYHISTLWSMSGPFDHAWVLTNGPFGVDLHKGQGKLSHERWATHEVWALTCEQWVKINQDKLHKFRRFENWITCKQDTFCLNTKDGAPLPSTSIKPFSQMLTFAMILQNIYLCNQLSVSTYSAHMEIQYNVVNTTLASLIVFNDTGQLKKFHDLVLGICWSVNEFCYCRNPRYIETW